MKKIKLDKEQTENLITMISVLFPHNFDKDDCYINKNGIIEMWRPSKKNPNTKIGVSIHWFEFCTKNVLSKLALHSTTDDLTRDLQFIEFYNNSFKRIFLDDIHPVDYLYKKFLKLKI